VDSKNGITLLVDNMGIGPSKEIIMSIILVGIVLMFMQFILPNDTLFAERESKNDVVLVTVDAPIIKPKSEGTGFRYNLAITVNGKYKGTFKDNTVNSIDVVPFIEYKGKGGKVLTQNGKDHFSIKKDQTSFSDIFALDIISKESPVAVMDTNVFDGDLKEKHSIALSDTGDFRIKLDGTNVDLFDKIPGIGKNRCNANFIADCGETAKFVELRECGEGEQIYICNTELSLCEGTVDIEVRGVDCGNSVDTRIEVKGGTPFDIKDKVYITFWERENSPACVDQAVTYTDLLTRCYNNFLGEHTLEVDPEEVK
jgi:hypothetical protein